MLLPAALLLSSASSTHSSFGRPSATPLASALLASRAAGTRPPSAPTRGPIVCAPSSVRAPAQLLSVWMCCSDVLPAQYEKYRLGLRRSPSAGSSAARTLLVGAPLDSTTCTLQINESHHECALLRVFRALLATTVRNQQNLSKARMTHAPCCEVPPSP